MRKKILKTSLIAASLFMAGCQSADSGEESVSKEIETTEAGTIEDNENEDGFPVLIESEDKTVEIKENHKTFYPFHLMSLKLSWNSLIQVVSLLYRMD